MSQDCSQNSDGAKLEREGLSRDDRANAALDPSSAPVDGRSVAHGVVFARDYARMLKRYGPDNTPAGHWEGYFGADASLPLAVASIQDDDSYKTTLRGWLKFLSDADNSSRQTDLRDRLGYLFAALGTLARALDALQSELPDSFALKGTLQNLIRAQLAPAFRRLVGYYRGGRALGLVNDVAPSPQLKILQRNSVEFSAILSAGLTSVWSDGASWSDYLLSISDDASVYGVGGAPAPFKQIEHGTTHTLFRSVFDSFLKAFMRVTSDAPDAFAATLTGSAGHAPHYALFLAFLQLLERARRSANSLTQRHLDFYYRTVLGLKERPAQPSRVHLLAELTKPAVSYAFTPGQLFKAGKDAQGKDMQFANQAEFVANKASIAELKTLYVHGAEPVASGTKDQGRIFASPVSASDDGQGAPLTAPDESWHPFFNKRYDDGALARIEMPRAALGFVIASHYLLLAEGARTITATFHTSGSQALDSTQFSQIVSCSLTTAKGWLVKVASHFSLLDDGSLELLIELTGGDEAIVPYSAAVHGHNFDTDLPVLLVQVVQDPTRPYSYRLLQQVQVASIDLEVEVDGLKTLVLANDLGAIDASKPFQPFGPTPHSGSGLTIGSKEVFQKELESAEITLTWQTAPSVYTSVDFPNAGAALLAKGRWVDSTDQPTSIEASVEGGAARTTFSLGSGVALASVDAPDLQPNEPYGTQTRHGFVKLRLDGGIGQAEFQSDLLSYLQKLPSAPESAPTPPQAPVAAALTLHYTARTTLVLSSADRTQFERRLGRFFHLAPFGSAEQHPFLHGGDGSPLLPQFSFVRGANTLSSEAELYIGVAKLAPPQNLALLFQVVDGTANPLLRKPRPHLNFSYLARDAWIELPENAVIDASGELLNSGIIRLAIPRDASSDNRLLPAGLHWLRVAVSEASDAVCRLRLVAAQALQATFVDRGNAPDASATPLPPGTVSKLLKPEAAVKGVSQPFASFGGRAAEAPQDFYQRVSERLRHKDRAIDLWDYEHLVLAAFPQIYKVKCLNHTHYEASEGADGEGASGGGVYRELAPGHVTVVTLPNLYAQERRDPLKPYTSLGLLQEIQTFLRQRTSCAAQLHVVNPQFEELRVSFKVKLFDGCDVSYHHARLQQEIVRFLSPWAFAGDRLPSFGGKVSKSALINFVEQQPCVDYVADFQLFHDVPCEGPGSVDEDEVTGSRAVSILVSAPPNKHQIVVLDAAAPGALLAESCGCGP